MGGGQVSAFQNPKAARTVLIALLAEVVKGRLVTYRPETLAQAEEAFEIAVAVTALARRARFRIVPEIREIQCGPGALIIRLKEPDPAEVQDLLEA